MLAEEVEGPGPYASPASACNSAYQPLRNQIADNTSDFCKYVHSNENWFLHNGKGTRLYASEGTRVKNYMIPASAGWREFARSRMLSDLSSLRYDGTFLDNVDLSLFRVKSQVTNSDGVVREFSTAGAYRSAFAGYVSVLSGSIRPAKLLWRNMTSDPHDGSTWNTYLPHLDGGMSEGFATGYAAGVSSSRWNNMLKQLEYALSAGKGVPGVS